MSQSPMAALLGHYKDQRPEKDRRIIAEESIQELLHVLADPGCRDIVDATSDSPLSAKQVSDQCEMPLSTTYRKLELLADAGLLEERTRITRSGKHPTEYYRSVTEVVVSISTRGEIELQVSNEEKMRSSMSRTMK